MKQARGQFRFSREFCEYRLPNINGLREICRVESLFVLYTLVILLGDTATRYMQAPFSWGAVGSATTCCLDLLQYRFMIWRVAHPFAPELLLTLDIKPSAENITRLLTTELTDQRGCPTLPGLKGRTVYRTDNLPRKCSALHCFRRAFTEVVYYQRGNTGTQNA